MKTRPWKFVDLARNAPCLTALFECMISRRKTVSLGPLKSPKNMLRKSILIGLFVLNNNRTIGEPKRLQEGRKGNCPHVFFYRWLGPAQEIGGGFSHGQL